MGSFGLLLNAGIMPDLSAGHLAWHPPHFTGPFFMVSWHALHPFSNFTALCVTWGKFTFVVLGGETDHVSGQGCSGSKHYNGDAEDEILHFVTSLVK